MPTAAFPVNAARPTDVHADVHTDAAPTNSVSRERTARESYVLKSRELERAAVERLAHEQQLVERRIRDQLEANQRELHSALDDILEDTIILPRSNAKD